MGGMKYYGLAGDAASAGEEQAYALRELLSPGLGLFEGGAAFLIGMVVLALFVGVGYLITKK